MSNEPIISSAVKLFVGNLPFSATSRTLEELFLPFGEIRGAKLVLDRSTRKPRGFGFVTFVDDDSAERALTLNNRNLDGRPLTVRRAVARGTGSLKEMDEDDECDGINFQPNIVQPSSPALCRFMSSPSGCRFGTRCRFAHSMNTWTGPGSGGGGGSKDVQGKKAAPPASRATKLRADSQSTTAVVDPVSVLPTSAAVVVRERLGFLKIKVKADGEPSPSQLGAFLRSVVTALHASVATDGGAFDMKAALGWSFSENCSLSNRPPPRVEDVARWLKAPVYVPVPPVSLKEFQDRSETGKLEQLLEEYGEYDPNWNKPKQTAAAAEI
mmetsp:Transcript_2879/g.5804  ORF Transcript_2879/g.5804 Transcript_2879/m.5804 type:complete len:326 (+) Transcript_2879:94-1071(+)